MMVMTISRQVSLFVLLSACLSCTVAFGEAIPENTNENDTCSNDDEVCEERTSSPRINQNDDCSLVWLLSSSDGVVDGGGVYTLQDRSKGTPVWKYGDLIIPYGGTSSERDGSTTLLDLAWPSQLTGGQYDSEFSIVPGLGMMTRSLDLSSANLLNFVPRVDEGGLTRFDSAGAGAISHYHNYTWFFRKDIVAGDQLVMPSNLRVATAPQAREPILSPPPPLSQLKESGYCLDNIRPRKSKVKGAGRGAFATRKLKEGSIVAPVPVIPIRRPQSAETSRELLRNYCFGHTNSTHWLYPYGPFVNLINHYTKPNVRLEWSKSSLPLTSQPLPSDSTVDNGSYPRPLLFLELVATREINPGEELYLDYGRAWEDAWWKHVQAWEPKDEHYTPSYVMDDAIRLLRTQKEQKEHPYPKNLITSCFYRYSDRKNDDQIASPSSISTEDKDNKIQGFRWKLTKGLFDLEHLRPCQVLRRSEDSKGRSAYVVKMMNRPGLSAEEIIPEDVHIVTHIPRSAIRFTDKMGTTDMHLPTAFRHEIGLDIFPKAWMDDDAKEK